MTTGDSCPERLLSHLFKRVLKRSYKMKQYRHERYYLEVPSRFNDLIAELYGKTLKVDVEKTEDEWWIKLKVKPNSS